MLLLKKKIFYFLQAPNLKKHLKIYLSLSTDVMPFLETASKLLEHSALEHMSMFLKLIKTEFPNSGRLMYNVIKSAVLEVHNEIKFHNYLPESKLLQIKELLLSAFQSLQMSWDKQEQIKKQKKIQLEALYKTVHHDDELSDEEQTVKQLKELFPLYEEVCFFLHYFCECVMVSYR